MRDEHILFRPPAEAGSLIVRVAEGCPWNLCAFCGMYKGVKYRYLGLERIEAEIRRLCHDGAAGGLRAWLLEESQCDARRIFLADGDVMHLDFAELEKILIMLNQRFKNVARINVYANGASILAKTDEQLRRLKELKLHTLYMGLESGDDEILKEVHKRETAGDMVRAGQRAQAAGLRMSVMALVGLAGKERSLRHARATADALNRMQPRLLSALRLIVTPNTPLAATGFRMISEYGAVAESRAMIAGLELEQTVFRADHSSNVVPLEARFPKDKDRLLAQVDALLASGRLDKKSPGAVPFWL